MTSAADRILEDALSLPEEERREVEALDGQTAIVALEAKLRAIHHA